VAAAAGQTWLALRERGLEVFVVPAMGSHGGATAEGQVEVLKTTEGKGLIPSVVHYKDDGAVVVGQAAREAILETPDHVVTSIKRLMGRGIEDVKSLAGTLPYTVLPNPDGGMVRLQVAGKVMTPVEISADILRAIKARAEEALLGKFVSRAVITVPAYFDDAARTATKDAARIAAFIAEVGYADL